jgi:DNA-directed RNA polymerase specialized sigma24 family protein
MSRWRQGLRHIFEVPMGRTVLQSAGDHEGAQLAAAVSAAPVWSRPLVTDASLAFTDFFRREFAPVLRTVELIVRDHGRAEELTQDAFVQLMRHWPKVSRYERPDAWVRRVAIHLALRALRRDRLWQIVRGHLVPPTPARPSRFDVGAAILQLPGSQRAAIVLHYYEDRPTAEVAAILGCSQSTARVHLHHARKRLAVLLKEDDRVA